jgi:hypothetical protein
MTDSDERELLYRRISDEVRKSVESELAKRYLWLGFVVAAITGTLVTLSVRVLFTDASIELEASKKIQEDTTGRLLAATEASELLVRKTSAQIAKFERTGQSVETRMRSLGDQAASLSKKLAEQSKTNLQISADLGEHVSQLTTIVQTLSSRANLSREEHEIVANQLNAVQAALGKSESGIEAAELRAERSKYHIGVRQLPGVDPLISRLEAIGYSVERFQPDPSDSFPQTTYEAILVGAEIPFSDAIQILSIVRQAHPSFKYIVFGTDISNYVVIGFGIGPEQKKRTVSDSEFNTLLAAQDQQAFHQQLRSLASFEW